MEDINENEDEHINNQYTIVKYLSFGGDADVYEVKEKKTNQKYAAKILVNEDSSFDHEIFILKNLNHCNKIAKYIDSGKGPVKIAGQEPGIKQYVILELAPNRDIGEYIRFFNGGFEEPFSKVIFYQIVKCIESIHGYNICHRDIKLDNCLFGDDFIPKINDFGHALINREDLEGNCGTKNYQAPEILEEKLYNGFQIDVFSLGATLFFLTFGCNGFENAKIDENLYQYIYSNDSDAYWKQFKDLNVSKEFKDLYFSMVKYYPNTRITIDKILQHNWFGNIRGMTEEQLKKYKSDIGLEQELEKRRGKILDQLKDKVEKRDDPIYDQKVKSITDEGNATFKVDAKPIIIKCNKFVNYYIDILNYIEPVDVMNSLCEEIKTKYGEDNCFIREDKNNLLKCEIYIIEKGGEKEHSLSIILYQISKKEHILRFLRKSISKDDFLEKFKEITKILKKLIE